VIDYYGQWGQYVDGIGRFARRQARTLATRIPVTMRLWPEQWVQAEALEEVAPLVKLGVVYPAPVRVMTTTLQEGIREVPPMPKRSVAYVMFERDRVAMSLAERLEREPAQVWVPCRQNAEALIAQGVSPAKVRVVPFSYDPDPRAPGEVRARESVPVGDLLALGPRRFYTMGAWQPRKNHDVLIGAFLSAFGPNDGASLLIKTRNARAPLETLDNWVNRFGLKWSAAESRRCVQIVDGEASQQDIRMMHAMHNIYVSASHGEGWEMPAFDAVLSGNTLVHVPYGATDDWAPASSIRVPYRMAPVPSWFAKANGWPIHAEWAYCSVDALAEALQQALPGSSWNSDLSAYSVERVAATMHRNLEELL